MEYLVTMTTQVPDGTPPEEVDDVRAREAANTRDLAAQGRLLRLWRPPLQPGEWRTIGLFAADDAEDLERTLASMPLRIWRTDEVTALGTHPNDPGPGKVPLTNDEYLVSLVIDVPAGESRESVDERFAREADRAHELAAEGTLIRLWTVPGQGHALGLWQAASAGKLDTVLRDLPLADWLTIETLPLTPHPSDPAAQG
jgi:muconolactone delta-isomerase